MGSITLYPANPAAHKSALLVLAHGAGAGQSHAFMVRCARGLAERGIDVATFNFPYMETGRKTPDRTPVLEDAFRSAVVEAAARIDASRLLIGGKSMGGRIATHLAAAPTSWPADAPRLDGVIALGYPLNPPGRSGSHARQDRVSHLFGITLPTLIVQGTRDSFGGPADIRAALGDRQPLVTVYPIETGDHSFAILKSRGKTQAQVDEEIWNAIVKWLGP